MSKRLCMVIGLGMVLILAVAFPGLYRAKQAGYQYRRCGHRPELKARLLVFFPYWQWIKRTDRAASYVTTHGCSGDRARGVLETIAFMQREFQARFGRCANSLSELATASQKPLPQDAQLLQRGFRVEYEGSRESWCARILQQADLPGYYLACSRGVYFCETRRAMTNDYPLAFFK